MGKYFDSGGLTTPGSALVTPSTGQPSMIGSPDQVTAMEHRLRDQGLQSAANNPVMAPKPQAAFQTTGQPSFAQAATAGATPGGTNALSPGLNKAGKLVTLLTSGLQGALAGRAASEQTVAATGGHRAGGAGMGFEAGYELPWQRAAKQLALQQQEAQVEATRAQSQIIQTPAGPMPAWLAKSILPAEIHKEGTLGAAQTGKEGRLGAADITGQYRMKALAAGTAPITQEDIQQYGLPPEFLGKVIKPSEVGGLQRAQNSNLTTVQGSQGPALVNKGKGTARDLGLGSPGVASRLAGGVQVGDPNNPGETTFTSMGNAIKTGAKGTQSASLAAAKTEAKSEVPTKIGDQKVAFKTMIQHADLLRQAVKGLQNGDQQTLAGLKNRFKNEFGYSGPITAEAIADAYKGEVSNVINKGHITDTGNEKIAHTLDPSKQNYQTIDSVLGAYQALAQSKMNMLVQQANAAKGANTGPTATDMLKKYPPKK